MPVTEMMGFARDSLRCPIIHKWENQVSERPHLNRGWAIQFGLWEKIKLSCNHYDPLRKAVLAEST